MKKGDFSHFVDSSGALIPIYDPASGKQFSGNIIPTSRFSVLSKSLLPLIPDPDTTGLVSGLQSNKLPAVHSVPINQHLWSYTLDHNLSSSQSVHFTQWRNSLTNPTFQAAPIVPVGNPLQSEINNTQLGSGFLLNYVKTISPSLVVTAGRRLDRLHHQASECQHRRELSRRGRQLDISTSYIRWPKRADALGRARRRLPSVLFGRPYGIEQSAFRHCGREQLDVGKRTEHLQHRRRVPAYFPGCDLLPVLQRHL